MNGLDISFLVIIFFFFVRGIFRGFVKEVMGIAGLILGFILARSYYPLVAEAFEPVVRNHSLRQVIGFVVLFVSTSLLIGLLGLVLDRLIKVTISDLTEGLLGAGIGLIKAVALSAIVLMVLTAFIRIDRPFFEESLAWPSLRYLSDNLRGMVPSDLENILENKPLQVPKGLKKKLPKLPRLDEGKQHDWKPVAPARLDSSAG